MRKILLGTTAVIGIAALGSEAMAQTAPTVRVFGYMRFHYANVDQENAQSENATTKIDSNDFHQEAEVDVLVEGTAANGIVYGAQIEIQFDGTRPSGSGTPGDNTNANLDEAFVFMRSTSLGVLQLGNNEGAGSQLAVGQVTGWASGGVDGDINDFIVGTRHNYLTFDPGDNTKVIYRSPQFFGFDFGASFAFNTAEGTLECGDLGPNCQRLSEQDGVARATNIYDLAARYTGTFAGSGVSAGVGYIGSSAVDPRTAGGAEFDGLSLWNIGLQGTFAGFTLGGHYIFGKANNGYNPLPSNGNNDDTKQWFVGAQYAFGAFKIGAHYFNNEYEGSVANAEDREDRGWSVGGNYTLAPGLDLVAEYTSVKVEENASTPAFTALDQENKIFLLGARLSF